MVDPLTAQRWSFRALYLGLAALLIFFRLLPLSTLPGGVPGPDLMLCMTFVWVLRRPDFLPAAAIVAVFLLEDLLLMRPPGLWTVLVLLATEFLRDRVAMMRSLPFFVEWATVAGVLAAMVLANRLILALAMVPQGGLGLTLLQLLVTAIAYPAVVFLTRTAFGLRRTGPGGSDALGNRL